MPQPEFFECRRDMETAGVLAENIREVLQAAEIMLGPQTWQGPAADTWADSWRDRRRRLERLLREADLERHTLPKRYLHG